MAHARQWYDSPHRQAEMIGMWAKEHYMAIPHSLLSRRRFLTSTGLATTAAFFVPRPVAAQEPAAVGGAAPLAGLVTTARKQAQTAKVTVEKLRGNISVLINDVGGNIAVLHGKDGKLLVDTGVAESRSQIADALARISADPMKYAINTHWHFDHTDGNQWLNEAGATIIAHENVRKRMSEPTRIGPWDHTFPPADAAALPTFTLRAAGTQEGAAGAQLFVNGTTVRLDTYLPAHTDGDLSIEFSDADVIHLGDLWWNGVYPFIDYDTGGSINGTIRAAESNVAKAGAKTLIIPGHGPVGDRSQLSDFRDMLVAVRDRVAALKKQGQSVEQVVAEKPTADYDATWGASIVKGALFTRLVYAGV
jgi:glyoxylase-like metal-dependent hydrolase (beta-lactamase superfamily II)